MYKIPNINEDMFTHKHVHIILTDTVIRSMVHVRNNDKQSQRRSTNQQPKFDESNLIIILVRNIFAKNTIELTVYGFDSKSRQVRVGIEYVRID